MKSIGELLRFLKPYRLWAILAPLAMVLEVAMDLTVPYMIQLIIDNGVVKFNLPYIIQMGGLMIGLGLVGAVGGIGCTVYAIRAAQYFGADLRETLFRKVQSFSFGNLDKIGTGQLITRLTNDVTQMQEAVAAALRILVRSPLLFIGGLVMSILTAPQLLFLPAILMVVVLIAVVWIVSRAIPMFTMVQTKLDNMNTVMQENLAGMRVVKAFVRAAQEIKRFGVANDALTNQMISVIRIIITLMPIMMILMNLGTVGALWFGGIKVQSGDMTVGQIIAFINYLSMTLMSLMMTSMLLLQLSRAAASADRIVQVLDTEPDVQDRPNAAPGIALRGRVTFENVTFSYDGNGGDPVLKDISFEAEPGQTVALLGTTGAGKSSLVYLIPRFYDVTGGKVMLDGVDVRDMQQIELRRHIGIALQEAVLFTGTVRDNIRYGRPEASEEEVIIAAKAAQAHDFIMGFPQGYDSEIGQRGVNLSGGQKQRIAIARALLVQPRVLILDDSTSSVDVETETEIQNELKKLMHDRTSFVIAQRISTVLTADKILVIDDGHIAAEGTHGELMVSSPIYRDIYDSQLGTGGGSND